MQTWFETHQWMNHERNLVVSSQKPDNEFLGLDNFTALDSPNESSLPKDKLSSEYNFIDSCHLENVGHGHIFMNWNAYGATGSATQNGFDNFESHFKVVIGPPVSPMLLKVYVTTVAKRIRTLGSRRHWRAVPKYAVTPKHKSNPLCDWLRLRVGGFKARSGSLDLQM